MSPLSWTAFNADKPSPETEKALDRVVAEILINQEIDPTDVMAVKSFVRKQIQDYKAGGNSQLNKTLAVNVFRPQEFDAIRDNDESLDELVRWLPEQSFEWRDGSKTVQHALSAFPSAGRRLIKGGRESVILDGLVVIHGRKVAIEVETSTNLDNGYWTLRQALRSNKADYGVMIVPWTAEGSGRANEGIALGRLDRECEGSGNVSNGAIYRVAIVRCLDLYRRFCKDKAKKAMLTKTEVKGKKVI